MNTKSDNPADFIVPLSINGMHGRMLRLPNQSKNGRHILFIYGQHSSLERWFGLALELSKFGDITMPDLPGLGGMTSMYKTGQTPTLDNMADYLATFIKLKFRGKKITIAGMSLGFIIVTRMLQKYPELAKKTDVVISIVGFARGDDFIFTKKRLFIYNLGCKFLSRKWPSTFFRYVVLRPSLMNKVYHRTRNAREKFEDASGDEFARTMAMEIKLWHTNDVRTQFKHNLEMFALDNTKVKIDLPVYHVFAKNDRYFNNVKVEQHLRQIFSDYQQFISEAPNHAPTVIATAADAAPFIPKGLRPKIRRKP